MMLFVVANSKSNCGVQGLRLRPKMNAKSKEVVTKILGELSIELTLRTVSWRSAENLREVFGHKQPIPNPVDIYRI